MSACFFLIFEKGEKQKNGTDFFQDLLVHFFIFLIFEKGEKQKIGPGFFKICKYTFFNICKRW